MESSASAWPWSRRLIWMGLLAVTVWCYGSGYCRALFLPGAKVADFFQEWASARNYFAGLPIYTPQRLTVSRYLGIQVPTDGFFIEINAHPPTSVLFCLPFGAFNFNSAFLLWNWLSLAAVVASVWLVLRGAGLRMDRWSWLPMLTLLASNVLLQHLAYGQLTAWLLLLITGAWIADRRGRPALAGALLATATAIKLFPGFLFLYFLLKGKWRALVAGTITFALLTALTALVFGPQTFVSYVTDSLPELSKYRAYWGNMSLHGFWLRLFDGTATHSTPLVTSESLARAAWFLSIAGVIAGLGWLTRSSRRRETDDLVFGLYLLAMLLVSPVTWDHYLILLAQPIALVASRLTQANALRGGFRFVLGLLWVNPFFFWAIFLGANLTNWSTLVASPKQNLLVVSLPFYALLSLFLIAIVVTRQSIAASATESIPARTEKREPAIAPESTLVATP